MIPQAYNVLENQFDITWPSCTTEEEYYCMMDFLETNVEERNEVCL